MRVVLACSVVTLCLASACGRVGYRDDPADSGSGGLDASVDAGSLDATLALDAGSGLDASLALDAPFPIDAPLPIDVPFAIDVPLPDVSLDLDAPFPIDAPLPIDAPVPIDVGVDAGAVDAAPPIGSHNVVFLTPLVPSASFGGLDGGDALCARYAREGGFGGTFVAFLSTTAVDARDRLGSAQGWVRPDGLPVALSQADLIGGRLIYPPSLDHLGVRNPPGGYNTFTGSGLDGRLSSGQACGDWTTTSGYGVGGNWDMPSDSWMTRRGASCGAPARLFCLQTDHTTPPPAPSVIAGRRIFAVYRPSSSETPDAACARGAVPLGRSFRAFVATSSSSAAGRFTLDRWPWVNTRGQLVASSLSDLTTDGLWAAVLGPSGASADFTMLQTGATDILSAAPMSCGDWTSMSSTEFSGVSITGFTAQHWFANGTAACSNPTHFLCLED